MDNADRLLERLRKDKIRPIPRIVVRLGRMGLGLLFGSCLMASAISLSLLFQELSPRLGRGWHFRMALLQAAPWIWSATALLLILGGMKVFRRLPRGWRVRPLRLGLAYLGTSLFLAFLLYQTDAMLGFHRFIAQRVPSYRQTWMEHVGGMREGRQMGANRAGCKKGEQIMKDSVGCPRKD